MSVNHYIALAALIFMFTLETQLKWSLNFYQTVSNKKKNKRQDIALPLCQR